jgi:hypothetical protein
MVRAVRERRRQIGTLRAISPRNLRSGRIGGRLWLILIPLIALFAVEAVLPAFGVSILAMFLFNTLILLGLVL